MMTEENKQNNNPNIVEPLLTREEVDFCSFPTWSQMFKQYTFPSRTFLLPETFLNYLTAEESIFIPRMIDDIASPNTNNPGSNAENDIPHFSVQHFIKSTIDDFGSVVPKLNWTAPKDAVWSITSQSLRCDRVEDVFMLLKSSDSVLFDLEDAYCNVRGSIPSNSKFAVEMQQSPQQHYPVYLVLKKWSKVVPSMEFRCFIYEDQLIAISQRNCEDVFPFLKNESTQEMIKSKIMTFWRDIVNPEMQKKTGLKKYVLDVYITSKGNVFIMDFNPFGLPTETLLFESWSDITLLKQQNSMMMNSNNQIAKINALQFPVLRITTNQALLPAKKMRAGMPYDFANGNVNVSTKEEIENWIKGLK